ncbi:MAG: hypothetical protein ACJ8ER_04140 [Allosphingosinicella sp.]
MEEEDFEIVRSAGPLTRESWREVGPYHERVLGWHLHPDRADILLSPPGGSRLQTKWPAFLPSPLFALRPGDVARIDWNARLRMSAGGSNRSSYYEQHTYWLALADAPQPRLFLDSTPRKHVDLRTKIY